MIPPLRVLIVEPDSRNHWHYTAAVTRALAWRNADVRLAAVAPCEMVEGLDQIPIAIMARRRERSRRVLRALGRIQEHGEKVWGFFRTIAGFHPAIVHLHGPLGKGDFLYFSLARWFGARVVYTAHDVTSAGLSDAFNGLRYRAADLVIVHSTNTAARLVNHYRVPPTRIQEIPHATLMPMTHVHALSRSDARTELGLPAEAHVVLFFGDIAPRKGLDLLIEAHAQVRRVYDQTYLVVAGQPRGDFSPYRDRMRSLGLEERALIDLRYVPDDRLRVYFSAADVIALPYREAYQSHVLQWAYAFARPVVATDVGGLGDAVSADGTGIVVASGSAGALAQAILTLVRDPALTRALGERARQMAETKYSWDAVSEQLDHAYRRILTELPSPTNAPA